MLRQGHKPTCATEPFIDPRKESTLIATPLRTSLPDYSSALARDEIGMAAQDRLRKSSSVVVRSVSCEYEQGVLFLRGQVTTEYCKQLAEQTVAGAPGVTHVVNQIEVAAACP
jgi:hypothetical protein